MNEDSLITDTILKELHKRIMDVFNYLHPYCNGNVLSAAKVTLWMKQHSDKPAIDIDLTKIVEEKIGFNHSTNEYEVEVDG